MYWQGRKTQKDKTVHPWPFKRRAIQAFLPWSLPDSSGPAFLETNLCFLLSLPTQATNSLNDVVYVSVKSTY